MQIDVPNAVLQTTIFETVLVLVLIVTMSWKKENLALSKEVTEELKGFAILGVIFAHVGYYLSKDTRFLFPISISAGVGVNLFLFLSGFGLTVSALKSPLSIVSFYKKRLNKLYTPMWLIISLFLILDFVVLQRTYPTGLIIQNYFGVFPQADLFKDLNSPLWYFTMIIFYYLIFPFCFWKKLPLVSPLIVYAVATIVLSFTLPVNSAVQDLYKLHALAFPLGMLIAEILYRPYFDSGIIKMKHFLQKTKSYLVVIPVLAYLFIYTSFNSGVGMGQNIEQAISLFTMFSAILVFVFKNVRFKLLSWFGVFSYEIYLIHWPLLDRFGFLFGLLPAFLALQIYLGGFIFLAYWIQKIDYKLNSLLR